MKQAGIALVLWWGAFAGVNIAGADDELPAPPPWSDWVHNHWIWENEGDENSLRELISGYQSHGIPVGVVTIDRPWETDSNTFIPHPVLYPNLATLIQELHDQNIRVLLWMTSIVNREASNYQYARENHYFLKVGDNVVTKWWGGKGSLIDYDNPAALAWWHEQMNPILDMGIDGWKLDATDPMVLTLHSPLDWVKTILFPWLHDTAFRAWRKYQENYYGDFFHYTRQRLGNDRVTMARPTDDYIGVGIPLKFAPKDVNFAGWVGDQDGNFQGLRAAIRNMASASRLGYVSYGSDIGGYRGGGRGRVLFTRWAQFGAFTAIMENGGNGEHRPWMYDSEVENIYRNFVELHQELIPYIYSSAARAYERGKSIYKDWGPSSDYAYGFGPSLFVAPMMHKKNKRLVFFPEGKWISFFDQSRIHSYGAKRIEVPLDQYPVFIKQGSILPLNVQSANSRWISPWGHKGLTVAVFAGKENKLEFPLYRSNARGALIRVERDRRGYTLRAKGNLGPAIFRIADPKWGATRVNAVTSSGVRVQSEVDASGVVWVHAMALGSGESVRVE